MNRLFKTMLAGVVMLAPIAGWAAIDGTHHDMTTYPTPASKTSDQKCAYCHSITLAPLADPGIGSVGVFCAVVCHNGRVPTAAIDGPGLMDPASATLAGTVGNSGLNVLVNSHGLTKADLDGVNYGGLDQGSDITATSWPHAGEANMQCTTCHAVHDGDNPPFLNAPLGTGSNATAFCSRCHTGARAAAATVAGRYQSIAGMGAHPTEFTVDTDDDGVFGEEGPTLGLPAGSKLGRAISFKSEILNRVAKSTASVAAFNATSDDAWVTGGHLVNNTVVRMPIAAASAVASTTMGCYSCHSAHQDQDNVLLLGSTNAAHVGGASSVLCIGCHGTGAANTAIWNAGITNYGHPANEGAAAPYVHDHASHAAVNHANLPASGTFPIDVVDPLEPALAGVTALQIGANGEILCNTCHDVHGGVIGQMAIRDITGAMVDATDRICFGCHGTQDTSASEPAWNRHHPTMPAASIDNAYDKTNPLTWDATYGGTGLMTMNDGLGCGDCHVFNDTAHNW